MSFDPDAYIASRKSSPAPSGGFDPDAYLASRKPETLAGRASSAVLSLAKKTATAPMVLLNPIEAAKPITGPLSTGANIIKENPEGALAAIPAIAVTGAGLATGGLGTIPAMAAVGAVGAGGEAFRQIGQHAIGSKNAPKTAVDAAKRIGIEGAKDTALEGATRAVMPMVSWMGDKAKEYAVDMGRRALGFTKMHLSSTKSAFEAARKTALANKAATDMLERGAISKVGSAETTAVNAMNILRANKSQMETVIETVDAAGVKADADEIGSSLIHTLKPKFANQLTAAEQILDDLKKVGESPLSVKNLDELRQRWGDIGFSRKMAGTEESKIYRNAWRLIDDKLTETISKAPNGEALASIYKSAKSTASSATNALKGLSNKIAQDAGNNVFGLPEYGLAAGQMASGNIGEALATLGVVKSLRGRGAAVTANLAKGVSDLAKSAPEELPAFARGGFQTLQRQQETPHAAQAQPRNSLSSAPSKETNHPTTTMAIAFRNAKADSAYMDGVQAFLKDDFSGAEEAWAKALEISPDFTEAEHGLQRLKARGLLKGKLSGRRVYSR